MPGLDQEARVTALARVDLQVTFGIALLESMVLGMPVLACEGVATESAPA